MGCRNFRTLPFLCVPSLKVSNARWGFVFILIVCDTPNHQWSVDQCLYTQNHRNALLSFTNFSEQQKIRLDSFIIWGHNKIRNYISLKEQIEMYDTTARKTIKQQNLLLLAYILPLSSWLFSCINLLDYIPAPVSFTCWLLSLYLIHPVLAEINVILHKVDVILGEVVEKVCRLPDSWLP